jgi:3-methyladenine DNA glycosylase AlkD
MTTTSDCRKIKNALRQVASPDRKNGSEYFFKTGPGQYAEGDQFIGVSVPDSRKIAKQCINAHLATLGCLLKSKIHEDRTCALHILVLQFNREMKLNSPTQVQKIFDFYLENLDYVNNWDLVDTSAPYILGPYIRKLPKTDQEDIINRLSDSTNMWHRRAAIVGTWKIIKIGDYYWTLYLAEKYLTETEDLQHKATGWMLREVWKQDAEKAEGFIKKHCSDMPRTTLRYAIERIEEGKRQRFLKGDF